MPDRQAPRSVEDEGSPAHQDEEEDPTRGVGSLILEDTGALLLSARV